MTVASRQSQVSDLVVMRRSISKCCQPTLMVCTFFTGVLMYAGMYRLLGPSPSDIQPVRRNLQMDDISMEEAPQSQPQTLQSQPKGQSDWIWDRIMTLSAEDGWDSPHLDLLLKHRNQSMKKTRVSNWSLNPSLKLRTQFQQKQMDKLCHRYSHRPPPSPGTYDHSLLVTHLLYDDAKRVIYCYAPKTGCTNMKQSFVLINKIYTPEELISLNVTHEDHLNKAKSLAGLSPAQRNYRLDNYFKFLVVRNPVERLLSAYRNKIVSDDAALFFRRIRADVVRRYRRPEGARRNSSNTRYPTFPEFIDYINSLTVNDLDDHFQPVSDICHPCFIKYHFYANFKVLNYDIDNIFHLLDIPLSYFSNQAEHQRSPTLDLLPMYYSQLSLWQKSELFKKLLKFELDFYYSLYPEERKMHKTL